MKAEVFLMLPLETKAALPALAGLKAATGLVTTGTLATREAEMQAIAKEALTAKRK